MSKKLYPETDIQNIANAIRNLNGSSDTYTVGDMASAITLPENGYYLKESASANPLSITDGEELNAQSCEVSFEPIQDLNGYDSPWIDSDVINKEPYLMRAVSGTATRIGNSLFDTLVGGTVVWNQLVQNGNFATNTDWDSPAGGTINIANNACTFTAGSNVGINARIRQSCSTIANHIYIAVATLTATKAIRANLYIGTGYTQDLTANTRTVVAGLIKPSTDGTRFEIYVNFNSVLSENDTVKIENAYLTDLTAMFNSTIADYIYSLEQATAGSGVAYFKSLFPKDYYDYNAGQLMSVKALSHKMVGFNQFDKSTATLGQYIKNDGTTASDTRVFYSDYIRVIPNTVYFFKHIIGTSSLSVSIFEYDSNKSLIGKYSAGYGGNISVGGKETEYTTTNDAYYIRFDGVKDSIDDTCINLHWDGERDGEYEAYEEHIYPLDSDLELRGILKLDANNKLYYDGDTYESDGTVTRKYGIVDLGTLNYTKATYEQSGIVRFQANVSGLKGSGSNQTACNLLCVPYKNDTWSNVVGTTNDKSICGLGSLGGTIAIQDSAYSSGSETAFKTAMSGVYLVYELATPTTETADTFQNPQLVDNWGTEEYTDSRAVQIPVGHETYQANICEISGRDSVVLNQNDYFDLANISDASSTIKYFPINVGNGNFTMTSTCPQGSRFSACLWLLAGNVASGQSTSTNGVWNGQNRSCDSVDGYVTVAYRTIDPVDPNDYVSHLYKTDDIYTTHTATFPSTIYGGSHEFVSGKAKSEWGYIASYNGETITEPWISDRDVYVAGTTPSTGAEVCYKLATPTEITLTPADVNLLKGSNTVWTDGDTVELEYWSKSLT